MSEIKDIYGAIKRFFANPWFMAVVVAIIVAGFAIWYGAAWSLIVALPIIYDYYIGHHIRDWHRKMYKKIAGGRYCGRCGAQRSLPSLWA